MTKEVYVVKASGERELFDERKFRASLERAGATEPEIVQVVSHITEELEDLMTTDHIYRHAFTILKELKNPRALRRYSLRRALLEMGPTGFPFEKYLAELFKSRGYEVLTDQTVMGRCVPHEIDVVAWNDSKLIMVEAKYHNQMGEKCDLKVALYVKARFDDLAEQEFVYGRRRPLDEGWLITNTKFTETSIQYGKCSGLKMAGWNHPDTGSIRDMIEDARLLPMTCISAFSNTERDLLLRNGVILCSQVVNSSSSLIRMGISAERARSAASEAEALCGT